MTIMWNWQVGLRMVSVGLHLRMVMIILRMMVMRMLKIPQVLD